MTRRGMLIAATALLAATIGLGIVVIVSPEEAAGPFDLAWNAVMVELRRPWTLAVAHVLNRVGGGWYAAVGVPMATIAVLLLVRRPRAAAVAGVTFAVSAAIVQVLKEIYGRARPDDMLVSSDYGSYPSGHTANAATLAVLLWFIAPRAWIAALGIAWTAAMALSRTVLSVHWITDTIGGMLAGTAAALLVIALLGRWAALAPLMPPSEAGGVPRRRRTAR